MLVILDGWGAAPPSKGNAIYQAKTPAVDSLERDYFATTLQASGIAVGLPWGREGNSEVGHLNLGAGRIIYQYLPRIVAAIRDGSFFKNRAFLRAIEFTKRNNSTLHIMGLFSSGSVHSYADHLYGLLDMMKQQNMQNVILHIFTDGKDASPKEAEVFLKDLQNLLKKEQLGKIGTVAGRSYAMDRNRNWTFTQKAYEAMVDGKGEAIEDPVKYIKKSYAEGKTDFNIEPAIVFENGNPVGLVKENDALIFFNFREDSARQLTQAFVSPDEDFSDFPRTKIKGLFFVSMTKYQEDLPIEVAFPPPNIKNPLAKVLSDAGIKQLHISEREKYAHVTYFFNGENENTYPKEERVLIPSTSGQQYEAVPEMQAYSITQKVIENIFNFDFILINYANADMLAHTGNMQATIKGVEAIDANLFSLIETAKKFNFSMIVTADHGHAEEMLELKTGMPKTKHSANPVPLYIMHGNHRSREYSPLYSRNPEGVLADVAPTILKIMGIPIPPEMTGKPIL